MRSKTSPLLIKRNKLIVADYEKYSSMKSEKGVEKYRHEYILELLSNKYFLAEKTINDILYAKPDTGNSVDPAQHRLFDDEQ